MLSFLAYPQQNALNSHGLLMSTITYHYSSCVQARLSDQSYGVVHGKKCDTLATPTKMDSEKVRL